MFDFLFKKRERLPLPYRRELHCHIIPGVDDGVQEMNTAIACIRSLHEFGVNDIIFTPHRADVRFENTVGGIAPLFEEVKEAVVEAGMGDIAMDFSFEYRLDEGFISLMRTGKPGEPTCSLRPLCGKYLLIENSFIQPLQGLDRLIFQLQSDGYYLILAHPERYTYYAGHQGRYYHHLQDLQVEFQCNILSFAGYYGPVAQKMAYWMLEEGYVNFLGSDLHGRKHAELIDKFLRSKEYAAIRYRLEDDVCNDRMDE